MVALLALCVMIPMVHAVAAILHNAAVANLPKARQVHVNATSARLRRVYTVMATHRRQWDVGAGYDSADLSHPPSARSEPMDESGHSRRRSMASHEAYRTLCVRLCDGYYFPISFSIARKYLARDSCRCQASCGKEGRLFFHRTGDADIAEMKDLEGRPYSKLESAFLYRAAYFPNCKCQAHPWEKEATERHRMYALAAAASNSDKAAPALKQRLSHAKGAGEPSKRPIRASSTDRASRGKSASSSDRANVPVGGDWWDKLFQSRN